MTIGNRIKKLRNNLNYSQEYVAEQLNVSRQAVSKWENDITSPDTSNIIGLATLLNSTVEYIAIGKEDNDEIETKEKETKKLSKKQKQIIITTISLLVLIITLFSIVAYIHIRPVDWDALACSGGYTTWIFDKYSEELTNVFLNGMEEEKDKIIFIEPIRGTQNAQWKDRQISIQFDIRYEHKDYGIVVERVNFIGNRYWIDSFKWNGAIIVG